MPRSTRTTWSKPHWRAMSVALEDQGEMVPRRGVTRRSSPPGSSGDPGWAPSKSVRRAFSSANRGADSSTKYQCSAARPRSLGSTSVTALVRRARRLEENAAPPRSLRISDMAEEVGKVGSGDRAATWSDDLRARAVLRENLGIISESGEHLVSAFRGDRTQGAASAKMVHFVVAPPHAISPPAGNPRIPAPSSLPSCAGADRSRQPVKRLLAVVFSLALIAWLASDGRWMGLMAAARRLSLPILLVAFCGFLTSYALRALRIFEEFRREIGQRFGTCLRIVLIHNALVNVLPFRSGEAAFPLLMRQTFGTPLTRGVASLFWLRLQDAFVVMALAALVWPGLPASLRAAGVASIVGLAWYMPRWARRPHSWLEGEGLLHKLGRVRDAFADSTRHARFGWLWTAANWSVKLAAILPVQGVAGFGTYEAGAAAALLPAGVPLERGLQAALALHLFVIASALLVGGLAWLFTLIVPDSGEGDELSRTH